MKLSVILTTYNSPAWLEKVIWGYSNQDYRNFELIIGDDGSTDETRQLIDRMRGETGMCIKHIRQKDKGFRKCRILNRSILAATCEYIVFSDGDCIPRHDFLNAHADAAEPGRYLSGSYYKLPMETSRTIQKEDILAGRCFDLKWLRTHGLKRSFKNLKLTRSPKLARFLNAVTPTRCNFKGSNGSVWLKDALNVNGFDERMAWGGLDREFGVRLLNAGIRPKHVRYNAIVLHLDHPRSYKNAEQIKANKGLRIYNARNRISRTAYGITELEN